MGRLDAPSHPTPRTHTEFKLSSRVVAENSTSVDCVVGDSSNYYWFLIFGQALHGIGGAALYTLGVPYLDDQIKIKNTPVYIGL